MSVTQATLLGDTFGSSASGTIPIGGIIMWSGTATPFNSVTNPTGIPVGWALCDGGTYNSRVTPDLRERFVVGAGGHNSTVVGGTTNDSYAVNDTGGSKDAIVVSHSHTASSSVTGSTNKSSVGNDNTGVNSNNIPDNNTRFAVNLRYASYGRAGGGANVIQDAGIESATPVISTIVNPEGVSGTNQNLPPYYALAFIMRVS